MTILHVTDFHAKPWFYDWALSEVRRHAHDALVLSGDLLDLLHYGTPGFSEQLALVGRWAAALPPGLPTFLVSGNHDMFSEDPRLKEARWMKDLRRPNLYVDGDVATVSGVLFECVPWGSLPEAHPNLPKNLPKIVVSHCPPAGIAAATDQGYGEDHGDIFLESYLAVEETPPLLVLSGHIHSPKSWYGQCHRTCVLNPGIDLSRKEPSHIVIDTDRGVATRRGGPAGSRARIFKWRNMRHR